MGREPAAHDTGYLHIRHSHIFTCTQLNPRRDSAPLLVVSVFAMKKVTTFLLLFFFAYRVSAQFVLSGKITDFDTGDALPGASIQLTGSVRGTTSGGSGAYALRNVPAGTYEVRVSYVGFETSIQTVDLRSGDAALNAALHRSTYQADEVVVSATRATRQTGMAFTNVGAEEIRKQNLGQDLPVLLNFQPSLVSTSDAGAGVGYTGFRIRGSDATRINVTLNGIPYNDAESQGTFWVNMPDFASSVSSIQIQRGAGTSTNGAGAFGATVNIQTNEFRKDAYAETNHSYGSFNTLKNNVLVGTGLLGGKFTVDARLSRLKSDGFIDRARSDLKSFYVSGAYFGKKSFVRLNVFSGQETTFQAWEGVPEARLRGDREGMLGFIDRNGLSEAAATHLLNSNSRTYNAYTYDNQVDNYQQDHYQLLTSHQLARGLSLNLNLHYTKGRGYFEQYREGDKLGNYGLPNVTLGDTVIQNTDLIRRRWLDNDFYGTVFSLDYDSYKRLKVSLGGGWNRYTGKHFGEVIWARFASTGNIRHRYYDNDATKTDFNLYGKGTYQFTDALNGYADLQVRTVNYAFLGFDQNQNNVQQTARLTFFNPKFGLNYVLGEASSVYGSLSVAHREPNRDDFTQSTPQSRPRAERLVDYEAGYRFQRGKVAAQVNGFFMNYRDQLILTGQVNDVGNYIRTNVPRSYRAGLEIELGWQPIRTVKWNANATFSQNKIQQFTTFYDDYDTGEQRRETFSNTDIAFSPNVIVGSQLAYTGVKALEIALLTKYVGRQFLDNTSDPTRQLDAYFTNDVRLIYSLNPRFAKGLTLSLLLNNVFNERYESNGYTFSYAAGGRLVTENFYYPQAGFNVLAGISLKF